MDFNLTSLQRDGRNYFFADLFKIYDRKQLFIMISYDNYM